MVRAWFMDTSSLDQREPHLTDPPHFITMEELYRKTGIEYFQIDANNHEDDALLSKIRKERGYTYQDLVDIKKETFPNYDEKLKIFFQEHIHTDEEIRLVLDGSGYFDARDEDDKWLRIEVVKGDMIILPAGIYHRFTLDSKNYIKAARYFVGEPVWTPHNRPADDLDARKQYINKFQTALTA